MVHKNEIGRHAPAPGFEGEDESLRAKPSESPVSRSSRGWKRIERWLRILVPPIVIVLVARELSAVDWSRASDEIGRAHREPVLWAAGITIACVSIMGLYDVFAMSRGSTFSASDRWRLGTVICSWTNFLAIGPLAGPALRLHFYRRAGMTLSGVVSGLAGIYAGMFSGIAAWITAVFVPLPEGLVGALMRAALALVLAPSLCIAVGTVVRSFRRDSPRESWLTYLAVGGVGALEWGLVATVYVLVGRAVGIEAPLVSVARTFFVGHVAGAASLLPGGLGSADTVWLEMNEKEGNPASIAAAQVLLFRCVYFLWPWGLSILASAAYFGGRALRRMRS
jgi:phosphatidylglycerol lysyltransferase